MSCSMNAVSIVAVHVRDGRPGVQLLINRPVPSPAEATNQRQKPPPVSPAVSSIKYLHGPRAGLLP